MYSARLCDVLFAVILVSVCVSSTPVTPKQEETTSIQQEDTKSAREGYHAEDPYLVECYRDCKTTRGVTSCLKYRALRFIHEKTSLTQDGLSEPKAVMTWGRVNLVALPRARSSASYTLGLSTYRATDSEIVKIFKFVVREVERLARSYTVTFNKRTEGDDKSPRLIGETLFSGAMEVMGSPRVLSMVLLEAFFLFEGILL